MVTSASLARDSALATTIFSLPASYPAWLRSVGRYVTGLDACQTIYERCGQEHHRTIQDVSFFSRVLAAMNIHVHTDRHEVVRIPRSGACVVVCNHPFGGIEGIALGNELLRIRPDVKVMANSLLACVPDVHDSMIFVNPFGGQQAKRENLKGIREAYHWLTQGGLLVVFPAGEVSALSLKNFRVEDKEWSSTIGRLIRHTKADVVPAFVQGRNSSFFHLSGLLHPRLRTLQLAREFANKNNMSLRIRFASPFTASRVALIKNDDNLMQELRSRSYLLCHKAAEERVEQSLHFVHQPIADAEPTQRMAAEVQSLPPEHLLLKHGELHVYYAKATQIPHTLREIARLREITFRYAGEGTGKANDSDEFDAWYTHLFIWNERAQEVVGAYRIGRCDEILHSMGMRGFYTNTLFTLSHRFFENTAPALELGRSFVRIEYQKNYTSLLLLWKGIGEFLVLHPQYKFLFGPVSISNSYTKASKRLLLSSLMRFHYNRRLARGVKARNAVGATYFANWDGLITADTLKPIEELSHRISDLEHDGKAVPVLLRQYLKLGGRVVGFTLDKQFSNVIDALLVVDITQTDKDTLAKYMGHKGAAYYTKEHTPESLVAEVDIS